MAHVVTERCVSCRYTDCCVVCPVDCFYEVASPAMLVIDPDTCIDCCLCVPECPIQAIWPMDELPEVYADWADKNAQLFGGGTRIKIKKDPLPSALSLAQLQDRERQKGWQVVEPSGAKVRGEPEAGEAPHEAAPAVAPAPATAVAELRVPLPGGLSQLQSQIFAAAAGGRFQWRTARGLAKELQLPPTTIQAELDQLVGMGHLKKQGPKTQGATVYAAAPK